MNLWLTASQYLRRSRVLKFSSIVMLVFWMNCFAVLVRNSVFVKNCFSVIEKLALTAFKYLRWSVHQLSFLWEHAEYCCASKVASKALSILRWVLQLLCSLWKHAVVWSLTFSNIFANLFAVFEMLSHPDCWVYHWGLQFNDFEIFPNFLLNTELSSLCCITQATALLSFWTCQELLFNV